LLEAILAGHPIPVHEDSPSEYQPIHHDDMVAMIPALLDAARTPATIVNWAGDEVASIEDWCAYLGKLTGLEPTLVSTAHTLSSVTRDLTRMHELVGHAQTKWQDEHWTVWPPTAMIRLTRSYSGGVPMPIDEPN
jgi:UDP-glucuronate 4-epimerase